MADFNKKAIIELLAEELEVSKKAATEAIEKVQEEAIKALKKGEKLDIPGFGKFEVKKSKARKGINPLTKEQINIPAKKAPKFRAAKALKEAVK